MCLGRPVSQRQQIPRREEKTKKRTAARSPARVSTQQYEFADTFERVLTKGVVVEMSDNAIDEHIDESETNTAHAWLRVSIADIDVLNAYARLSWRYSDETEE